MVRVGDYVVRKSYGRDILFRIVAISGMGIARLKGISYRIIADAPINDLELAGGMRFTNKETSIMEQIDDNVKLIVEEKKDLLARPVLQKTGKVLHIDGDTFYLNLCLRYYETLGVNAVGEHVLEADQPKRVRALIEKHNPDILVLTGHDALNKNYKSTDNLKEYKNSSYFIEGVKEARSIRPYTEQLVIFAGACQSYFEKILEAGADYAASPNRVLIHALDPVFIVERIAYCPLNEVLSIEKALMYTITKFKGLGGYEILGKARKGGPVVRTKEVITAEKGENKENDEKRDFLGNSVPYERYL